MPATDPGNRLAQLAIDSRGATAVEYGLILALIFLAVMGGVSSLGDAVRGRWDDIANHVVAQ